MTVATAGKILTEEELRTYAKCSQLYQYGGSYESDNMLVVVKTAFERIVSDALRNPEDNPKEKFAYNISYSMGTLPEITTLMEGQIEAMQRASTTYLHELFSFFSLQTYIPVTGPLPYRVQVSKTPVELMLSGTFRTKRNQTLHAVSFTPYVSTHSMQNDPLVHLKLATLKNFVSPHGRRAQAKLHLFGISKSGALVYTAVTSEDTKGIATKQIEFMVKSMEGGIHYPLVPCPYSCPFKANCKPGEIWTP